MFDTFYSDRNPRTPRASHVNLDAKFIAFPWTSLDKLEAIGRRRFENALRRRSITSSGKRRIVVAVTGLVASVTVYCDERTDEPS